MMFYKMQSTKLSGIYRFFVTVFLMAGIVISTDSQTINFWLTNGDSQNYQLTSASKIQFLNGSLIFNNISTTPIQQIRKITFNTPTEAKEITALQPHPVLSPNPAKDYVIFSNLPAKEEIVSVYSITGAIILTSRISSSSNILDISMLNKGAYVVKTQNFSIRLIKL